jgi:cellulose synthase/poly-beta-1,6-N-acetylglucosamine synthase-like glycosyltransferase
VSALALALEWFFLVYIAASSLALVALDLLALPALRRRIGLRGLHDLPALYSGFEPPISVLVVAHDEAASVVARVRTQLALEYPEFEVIVVNDGSTDATLAALQEAFDLAPFPEVYWRRLTTRPLRAVYHSRAHANLRVVDKEHGGRADALNAGVNASRYPLYCPMPGAQVVPHRECLRRLAAPFLDDPHAVAAGGAVRMADGCVVAAGRTASVDLPPTLLGAMQFIENLRERLFSRIGWASINAELTLAGSIVLLRKDAAVEAGGHASAPLDEASDLVARLHSVKRQRRERYSVNFVPDTVGWRAAAATLGELRERRVRAQHALAEVLDRNSTLLSWRGGTAGLVAWPFAAVFECYGPLIEVAAYLTMAALFASGLVPGQDLAAFVAFAFAFGFLATVSSLLVEEMSFRQFPRFGQLGQLTAAAIVENFGYRQLVAAWRAAGMLAWARAELATRKAHQRR